MASMRKKKPRPLRVKSKYQLQSLLAAVYALGEQNERDMADARFHVEEKPVGSKTASEHIVQLHRGVSFQPEHYTFNPSPTYHVNQCERPLEGECAPAPRRACASAVVDDGDLHEGRRVGEDDLRDEGDAHDDEDGLSAESQHDSV